MPAKNTQKSHDSRAGNIFSKWDFTLSKLTNTKVVLSSNSNISELYSFNKDVSSIS